MTPLPLPNHIAIIMDGNGRWGLERGVSRIEGHRQGANSVRSIVRSCREQGVKALTLYAFSEQNWGRPQDEVQALMALLAEYVRSERAEILDNHIRLVTLGDVGRLPKEASNAVQDLVEASRANSGMVLCLALSYGSREEIVAGIRTLAQRVADGELSPEDIDEETFEHTLDTHPVPANPDLIIRTGGEQRLSNFLLWQAAYAELYFTETMWPDFGVDEFTAAIEAYRWRHRRYGLVEEDPTNPLGEEPRMKRG